MWPIHGASKAKRLTWGPPQNQISWAYMKMLREGNKSMKVYDVNPYIEVYQFSDNVYGLFNQNCDGMGDVWMWLTIGPEKALLVDTAFGIGDMKGLVDKLTGGMPLIVVNTHGGPDHCLGNTRFGRVYCNEYDYPSVKARGKQSSWDYLFDKSGNNIWLQFDKKDIPVYKDYELVPVKNGHIFNLGGDHDVEVVWTGGHSPGHSMFLDKKNRRIFAGDVVCSDVIACGGGPRPGTEFGQYLNLTTYRDNLTKLVARRDEYDYLFPGHFMMNLENTVLVHILEALNAIIANPDSYNYKIVEVSGNGGPSQERMFKFVQGFSTIAYTKNGVYPPKA